MDGFPLLIEFVPHTSVYREPPVVSQIRLIRNGPPGTFIVFDSGARISLPTDQIVFADDTGGVARVGFGGMTFAGLEDGRLIFLRVHDLVPDDQLSPERGRRMILDPHLVSSIHVDGRPVWRAA
jgi:hypothetical protein